MENVHSQTQEAQLNKKMYKLYSAAVRYLAHSPDNYLLGILISHLIRKSYAYKKTWANTAEIAILPYKEREGRHTKALMRMIQALRRWMTFGR